jgi:hypothetical protein
MFGLICIIIIIDVLLKDNHAQIMEFRIFAVLDYYAKILGVILRQFAETELANQQKQKPHANKIVDV